MLVYANQEKKKKRRKKGKNDLSPASMPICRLHTTKKSLLGIELIERNGFCFFSPLFFYQTIILNELCKVLPSRYFLWTYFIRCLGEKKKRKEKYWLFHLLVFPIVIELNRLTQNNKFLFCVNMLRLKYNSYSCP